MVWKGPEIPWEMWKKSYSEGAERLGGSRACRQPQPGGMGRGLGCGCEPGGRAGGEGCGAGAAPVPLLVSWWFTARPEEGALLPPVSCRVWGRGVSSGAAGLLECARCVGRGVPTAEGWTAGWVSCSSAAPCSVWVGGLGSGTAAPGSVCAGVQWERVEWCWEESWGGAPAAALASGRFCALPGDAPCFICWCPMFILLLCAPLSVQYSRAGGSGRLEGTPSRSWGCIYRAQRERKGFGSLRYKREQGAPRPSCLQWCLCCFITLSWC